MLDLCTAYKKNVFTCPELCKAFNSIIHNLPFLFIPQRLKYFCILDIKLPGLFFVEIATKYIQEKNRGLTRLTL